jgi:GTP pyrophosphokinase
MKIQLTKRAVGKLTDKEYKQLVRRYRKLLQATRPFFKRKYVILFRKALDLILTHFSHRRQPGGEPYVLQALEISTIMVEQMGMGTRSVLSVLLFDLVKDQIITIEFVKKEFDERVATILEGLLKVDDLKPHAHEQDKEKFQKLIVTIAEDVRVILVTLARLLIHMRELNYMPQNYQLKKAMESLAIYAPLAHRLGLYQIKSELENLSLKYLKPDVYRHIIKKLEQSTSKREKYIKKFVEPLEKELKEEGFSFEIKGRPKSVYSIWQKMEKQQIPFEQVYDIFAIRIIINSVPKREKTDCWKAYSVVTDLYQPNPQRLRDWISVPKSNGYESLHITVVGPDKKWVEVQIRTRRMDEVAEKGYAAHWRYKGIKSDKGVDTWMNKIRNLLEADRENAVELIDSFKLNLYTSEVFAFTPTGELRKLPKGATVLDFAYDIHTDVGYHCIGAKVNQKNVSIRQQIKNGDHIEIITSKNQKPKSDWLNFIVTSKARGKVKQAIREDLNKQAEEGKERFKRRLKNWKVPYSEELLSKLVTYLKEEGPADFFHKIAIEAIDLTELKDLITKPTSALYVEKPIAQDDTKHRKEKAKPEKDDFLIIDEKIDNLDYKLAKCCNPIYGDDIFGFVTVSEGIKIHKTDCPNAHELLTRYNYRVLKAKWRKSKQMASFQTTIKVSGIDELGMLNKISNVISNDLKVHMRSISIDTHDGIFEGNIKLYVESTKHLDAIMSKIKKNKGVLKVVRIDGED